MNLRHSPSSRIARRHRSDAVSFCLRLAFSLLLCGPFARTARASTAYGSINNFDVVNDTGSECHGFEIELDDVNCSDITYTYDWNHYGKCKITEDLSVPGHPRTIIRWASGKKPDGTWSAYTAIPSGTIAPTDGHQFTNPSINFGGEHFGVGYTRPPSAVRYNWLVDDGNGNLVKGPAVQVSTPVFTYYPPAQNVPAQVVAAIQPPPPPAPPPKEFGDPVWVKEIRTTTHNNGKVELRDLVSDDPDNPDDPNWRNGEPDEVETEWQLMQTDFNKADGGANGELAGAAQELPDGDEVVTRRYEFYAYTGPLDEETGEAMADSVAADGIHGVGTKTINGVETDLSQIEVVGNYIGAQMAAVDPEAKVGLIDQVPDGEAGSDYPARRIVVAGATPFTASLTGALPQGMNFDTATGILDGAPSAEGEYWFTVTAEDQSGAAATKDYILRIAPAGEELPPAFILSTSSDPADSGTTTGDASYDSGTSAEVTATPSAGFAFLNWTENGVVVSSNTTESVTMNVNHALVAHFVPTSIQHTISASASPTNGGSVTGDGSYQEGSSATLVATAAQGFIFGNWTESGTIVSTNASYSFTVSAPRTLVANFTAQALGPWTITTASSPSAAGTNSGGGTFTNGESVTVSAAANIGYMFKRWMEGTNIVSSSTNYTFVATNNRALTAKFARVYNISATSDPVAGGTTSGGGWFEDGDMVSLGASAAKGYYFLNWTENGTNVTSSNNVRIKANPDHALVAHFGLVMPGSDVGQASDGAKEIQWPSDNELPGWIVQASTNLVDWVEIENEVEDDGVKKRIRMNFDTQRRFYRMIHD